jgi:hypothetical protein
VVAKVSEGANLSAVERTQYGYIVRTVLYDVQEAYLLNRVGRLDYEYWSTRASIILAYLAPQAARDIYHRDASIGALHAGFMQWLDSALEERYGN